MPLLSLPHLCMLDASPQELIKAAAATGFQDVALRMYPTKKGESQHPLRIGTPMMSEVEQLLSDTGLQLLDVEAFWLHPDTDPNVFVPTLEAAARLGAQSIQTICGDSDFDRAGDTFARFAELAKPLGLRLELEPMAISPLTSLSKAVEIVERSGTSNVGILVDTLHLARCNIAVADLKALPANYVNVLQLCDAPLKAPATLEAMFDEARYGRLLPGDGELPLAGYWAALPAHTHVSVEVPLASSRGLPFQERARIVREGYDRFCKTIGKN